jgi:hypothetical protein
MSIEITRNVQATVRVSAFDLGRAFAGMASDEQAQFFNGVAAEVKTWVLPACIQWDGMRRDMEGLPGALEVFKDIAECVTYPIRLD